MALSSILVDLGRVATYQAKMIRQPDGSLVRFRVEGETQMEWVFGSYFDCRIDAPNAPEGNDAGGARVEIAQRPSFIFDVEDYDENQVELHANDRVEVTSEDWGGPFLYEVGGEPTLYRKKYGLICGEATLVRLIDETVVEQTTPSALADVGTSVANIVSSGS